MSDLMHLLRSQSLKLAPFFNTVVLYFLCVNNGPQNLVFTTVLKCLPIAMLMVYVVLKGFDLSKSYKYSHLILFGLLFSAGGDALLNVDLFPFGMASFAVAHIFYIAAFGWKPLKWGIGVVLYIPVIVMAVILIPKLEPVLAVGVPIYCVVVVTMGWRATALAVKQKSYLSIFCAVGSFLFIISDGMIAFTLFLEINIPNSRIWIMSTYYLAQFAIALSTATDGRKSKPSPKKPKAKKIKD